MTWRRPKASKPRRSRRRYDSERVAGRAWHSPTGESIEVSGNDHGDSANEILARKYKGWNWEDNPKFSEQGVLYPTLALEYKGWVRAVDDGIYSVWSTQKRGNLDDIVSSLDPDTRLILTVDEGPNFPRNMTAAEYMEWAA